LGGIPPKTLKDARGIDENLWMGYQGFGEKKTLTKKTEEGGNNGLAVFLKKLGYSFYHLFLGGRTFENLGLRQRSKRRDEKGRGGERKRGRSW